MFRWLVTSFFCVQKFVHEKHDFPGVTFCTHKRSTKMYIHTIKHLKLCTIYILVQTCEMAVFILEFSSFIMKETWWFPKAAMFYVLPITG